MDNHRSDLRSFGISTKDEKLDVPPLYLIHKLNKCPYNQRYIGGSTKPLSKLLTSILSAVKTGLQSYCDISYSRGGVNQMWILQNSKELLEYIQSRSLSSYNSIKTFNKCIIRLRVYFRPVVIISALAMKLFQSHIYIQFVLMWRIGGYSLMVGCHIIIR
jgi:hypothetical protein